MLDALRSDRLLQGALGLLALLAGAYLIQSLVGIGAEFRTATERQQLAQATLRHEAVCRQLGKGREAPDHARCLHLLEELRGWHEHAVAERSASIL